MEPQVDLIGKKPDTTTDEYVTSHLTAGHATAISRPTACHATAGHAIATSHPTAFESESKQQDSEVRL